VWRVVAEIEGEPQSAWGIALPIILHVVLPTKELEQKGISVPVKVPVNE
jgi:hypothetical protein